MQVGLSFALYREVALQMFGAYHILEHGIIIWPKSEQDK